MIISAYQTHIFVLIFIYIILAVSLNLALGYTGLLNLGHVAFFGIGAYTSALLAIEGMPYLAAMISAGLFASIFGYLLVRATDKLKGDYLAMATLGFSFVVYSLLLNLRDITRGAMGIPGIPKPSIMGLAIRSNDQYLIFVVVVCTISVYLMYRTVNSPFGKLLEANRDNALSLRVLGKNTFVLKYKAMMISAFFAGISGSLYAHYITFIDPTSFYISELILILTIVIVGGLASIRGSIAATVVIIYVPEILRTLDLPGSVLGPVRQALYAVILIAILMIRPRGIFGKVDLE
ncbi:MAG: branched-chain amino acid ABC transporter permease [Methanosarcinaceae archaeon]|nr:branched-chain amino acid ABC transporter permease [Methanosarcinaceae archaeon]